MHCCLTPHCLLLLCCCEQPATPLNNSNPPNCCSTNSQPTNMLFPALALPLLTARVASGPAHPPDDLPPWGAALLATVGRMEEEISSLQTTVATQSRTIHDHSARIRELEAGPRQPGGGSTMAAGRRLQPALNSSKVVHIHSISVHIPEGPTMYCQPKISLQ
jgi:hypothetical protein